MNVISLRCVRCDARVSPDSGHLVCPSCGVDGILDVEYDYDRVVWPPALAERTIWRYLPLLPVAQGSRLPTLRLGCTPVVDAPRLAALAGVARYWLKDDGRMPTASFKDRASAIGVVKAAEAGAQAVACASTGNAASSLAGFAANVGLPAYIFVPATAPDGKVAQLRAFGAHVLLVDGTYEDAFRLSELAIAEFGWYTRNAAVNPYLVEGKKTCGLEIGEEFALDPPDVVAVSVGDGCTIAAIWKGLREMHTLGVLRRLPRLLGVQAAAAAPLVALAGVDPATLGTVHADHAASVAESIAVAAPRNWRKALDAVRASHGTWIAVDDEAILDAARDLPALTGVFAEPSGAAAFAGVCAARRSGAIGAGDSVVHVVTGNGLKDIRGAAMHAPPVHRVAPSLDAVREVIAREVRR